MSIDAIVEVGCRFGLCSLFLFLMIHPVFAEQVPLSPYSDRNLLNSQPTDLNLGVTDSDQVTNPKQLVDLTNKQGVSEVSVLGAVQKPGVYTYVNGMRISDLLFWARGVSPNADSHRAELQRYSFDKENREDVEIIPVDLNKVINGDVVENLLLQNHDELIVFASPQEVDQKDVTMNVDRKDVDELRRFGYDYFEGARKRILRIEETLSGRGIPSPTVKDAISGFVGPTEMMSDSVSAIVSHNRVLEPGDKLTVIYWSDQTSLNRRNLVVDNQGYVILPGVGRLVVRGMTIDRFERVASDAMSRTQFTDLKLIATFDALHTIQVFIVGHVFRPGSYATSSVTSLFNALYLSGGPNADGALRDIWLTRNGETIHIDFYKYLMDGDSSQDINLLAGDTIFIGSVGRLVSVEGEVKRPGVYELLPNERFDELIQMAGGLLPTGYSKRIQIESVQPNMNRVLREVDLSVSPRENPDLYDNDFVLVLPVLEEVLNIVRLDGMVKRPGTYELMSQMRISDLIGKAEGVLGESFLPRADLFRLNKDERTTTVVPVHLGLAIQADERHNLRLQQRDRLMVYSKFDVEWTAKRIVSVQGAVENPGSFERSDEMKISDLIVQAGGVSPEAHLQQAMLFRLNQQLQVAEGISIDLGLVSQNDPKKDIYLHDGDVLIVFRFDEIRWFPDREVSITGNVQRPGVYPRFDNMRISDLIFLAGGILPRTDMVALLLQQDQNSNFLRSQRVDLLEVQANDFDADISLTDGDRLIIYRVAERHWEPVREVSISGAVQQPGVYERVEGMRVSDLLFRAGGVNADAYLSRANLRRYLPDHKNFEIISVDLNKLINRDVDDDLLLQDRDSLIVFVTSEVVYESKPVVTIYGAVHKPGEYFRYEGMRVSDLLFLAGGVLPSATDVVEIARARAEESTKILKIDLGSVKQKELEYDVLLFNQDVVTVSKIQNFRDTPMIAKIEGQVKFPGVYAIIEGERLSSLIKRAGGFTGLAFVQGAIFTRTEDNLIDEIQRESLIDTLSELDGEKEFEYIRELARSQLSAQQPQIANDLESTVSAVAKSAMSPLSATSVLADQVMSVQTESSKTEIAPELSLTSGSAVVQSSKGPGISLVTPARKIEDIIPNRRVFLDLPAIMQSTGSEVDPIMKDGDYLVIPEERQTVLVTGAVLHPSSFIYQFQKKLIDYVEMAGSYAKDADLESVYVLKANGLAHRSDKVKKIESGDIIVVPTKVMVEKVSDTWGQIVSLIRMALITGTTLLLVRQLTK
ncbi:hypothetical protein CMK22_13585 [Candidatus Poribacteria bacterium]|nr:hypothetical protein [Candidatus Poribacteria bacterium]